MRKTIISLALAFIACFSATGCTGVSLGEYEIPEGCENVAFDPALRKHLNPDATKDRCLVFADG